MLCVLEVNLRNMVRIIKFRLSYVVCRALKSRGSKNYQYGFMLGSKYCYQFFRPKRKSCYLFIRPNKNPCYQFLRPNKTRSTIPQSPTKSKILAKFGHFDHFPQIYMFSAQYTPFFIILMNETFWCHGTFKGGYVSQYPVLR